MISLDSETTGIDFHHGTRPFLITTCDEEGNSTFWEWEVDPLTRKPNVVASDLREIQQVIDAADYLVLQNVKFDWAALQTVFAGKLHWDWAKVYDTLLAGHLLASNQPHDLTSMTLIYLNENVQPYEDRVEVATNEARRIARSMYPDWQIAKKGRADMPSAKEKTWKFDMWLCRALAQEQQLPDDHEWWTVCSEYANSDSTVTLPLFLKQRQILEERDLWSIYLERLKLLPVITAMESRGVTMSKSRLEKLERAYSKDADACRSVCIKLSEGGIEDLPVNGASNALKDVIFNKFGLKSSRATPKGQPSLDKFALDDWLVDLSESSREWKFINSLRTYRKRKTGLAYIESYRKFWVKAGGQPEDCRVVYPSLNPTGTDTLRWSSQNPNEQQISKQEGTNLREAFGPNVGREWWSLDYENLELRIPSYESGEKDLIYVFDHPDDPPYYGSYHLVVADALHPKEFAKHGVEFKNVYATTLYQWTKNGNFAIIYGAQEATADRTYHTPGAFEKIRRRFPRVAALGDKMMAMADKCGYVETIPDKTVNPDRGYPILCSRTRWNKVSPTVPLNYHVQSTAMWCTMKAMIRCAEYLESQPTIHMILQVHDECVFDFPARGKLNLPKVRKLQRLMTQSGDDIGVPLRVSASYHPKSWGEKQKL